MANYYGVSNYVRVNDEAAFRAALSPFQVSIITGADGTVGILDNHPEGAGFDWTVWDGDDPTDTDPVDLIAPHLRDGEVMILMESGHEKHRYVAGYAIAFNNQRQTRTVNIADITSLAADLGTHISPPAY